MALVLKDWILEKGGYRGGGSLKQAIDLATHEQQQVAKSSSMWFLTVGLSAEDKRRPLHSADSFSLLVHALSDEAPTRLKFMPPEDSMHVFICQLSEISSSNAPSLH